jgi:hypothetical protein
MATFELFSKRRKRAAGEMPDVYTYDIPIKLRIQITHIWNDTIGNPGRDYDERGTIRETYLGIVDALRREYGVFILHKDTRNPNDAYHRS